MNHQQSLYIILLFIPLYQMLFYTVQLVTFRTKTNSSQLPLGIIILIMSVYLVLNLIEYIGHLPSFDYTIYLLKLPVLLSIVPTYFVFFRKLITKPIPALENSLLAYYFSPLFVFFLNFILFLSIGKHEWDVFLITPLLDYPVHDLASILLFAVYILANIILVGRQMLMSGIWFRKLIKENHEIIMEEPVFNPRWNRMLLLSLNLFVLSAALQNLLQQGIYHFSSILFNCCFIISGGMAGYFALRQHKHIKSTMNTLIETSTIDQEKPELRTITNGRPNYNNIISDSEAEQIMAELNKVLRNKKPFLRKDLHLSDIARELRIDNLKLTNVLNDKMETNFYGLINKYRVEEAKNLLSDPANRRYTIESISQMVGFRSKTSFNNYFKEETGFTPSQYRKKQIM